LSEAEIKQNPFIYNNLVTVKAVELRQTLETNNEGMSTLTLGRSNLCISERHVRQLLYFTHLLETSLSTKLLYISQIQM